jgi:hypothetical protein
VRAGPRLRRAREDAIAGLQRQALRQVCDERRDVEEHVGRVVVLLGLAVHTCLDPQVVGVNVGHDAGTQRRKRIQALAHKNAAHGHLGELQLARAHVVAAGVAQHVVERLGDIDVAARLPDDHDELRLVVNLAEWLLLKRRVVDRVAEPIRSR